MRGGVSSTNSRGFERGPFGRVVFSRGNRREEEFPERLKGDGVQGGLMEGGVSLGIGRKRSF